MKILYFDTETTGKDPIKNGIIQISGIIEIDGVVKETFNLRAAPGVNDQIEQEALDVTGVKKEDFASYPSASETYSNLLRIFSRYVNKFNPKDKFTPAGYNVRFDLEFLSQFFRKNNDKYFGSWIAWQGVDALPLVHYMHFLGELNLPNYKLGTLCEHFGIQINAHDALSDITATRELVLKIKSILQIKYQEFCTCDASGGTGFNCSVCHKQIKM